jgi:hypothetical protein
MIYFSENHRKALAIRDKLWYALGYFRNFSGQSHHLWPLGLERNE